jgi:hypothetical protein
MLQEIRATRQISKRKCKRWFTDSDMDLFIWFNNDVPIQFQLSYNKQGTEHAINWNEETGYSHNRIDPGDQKQLHTRYKMAPILVADGEFDAPSIARQFLLASERMNETLADFIYARLLEHPGRIAIHSNLKPASKHL